MVLAQDPQAQAVEGGHRGLTRAQSGQPVLHLLGRPAGERDRQEVPVASPRSMIWWAMR